MLRGRLWVIPAAAGTAYLVVLLARLHGLVTSLHWLSDSSGCFTFAEAVADGLTGGDAMLTTYGAYVPLWFGLATVDLPFHRELWQIAPLLTYLAAAAVVVWSVRRVSATGPAVAAAVIAAALSPAALYVIVRVSHHPAYLGTALAGAFVVWAFAAPRAVTPKTVALAAAVVLLGGTLLASDALMIFTALLPLAGVALLADRRARAWCAAVAVAMVPVALATTALMNGLGFRTLPREVKLSGAVFEHAWWLVTGIARLGNGGGSSAAVTGRPVLSAVGVVLVAAGVALAAAVVWGSLRPGLRARSARDAHVRFWALSALLTAGVFVVSTSALEYGDQYYVTVIFAVAALAPLARLAPRWRLAGAVAVAAYALLGAVAVGAGDTEKLVNLPIRAASGPLERFAEQQGVRVGYAGWWDGPNLTWFSRGKLDARPIYGCSNPGGANLCPFYLMRVSGWYQPREQRTFLIVNPDMGYVTERPPELGDPIASFQSGRITMFVYPYDIASRLGPAPN